MSTMHTVLEAMAPEAREALLAHSHQVTFPAASASSTNAGGLRSLEFDAAAVRTLCDEDSAVGRSVAVAAVIADRLDSARTRLLDLFAPHGSGTPLAYTR
ncbi:hypothetical protein ABZ716_05295 [Streptomyces sp. NPDC006687]|uniref:hypothetical protein n=1 Tax=unclassified Streptomyces TaxID=2593676 RepID=UPI0033F90831